MDWIEMAIMARCLAGLNDRKAMWRTDDPIGPIAHFLFVFECVWDAADFGTAGYNTL